MLLALAIVIIAATLAAEWYIYRRYIHPRGKRTRRAYICTTAALWLAVVIPVVVAELSPQPDYGLLRLRGVMAVVFMFNAANKIIVAAFGWACGKSGKTRMWRISAIVLLAVVNALMLVSATWGRTSLRVERVTIYSPELPPSFDGFRIALFADLHAGALLDRHRQTARVAEVISALKPDLVINGGDLVNNEYDELDERLMRTLAAIAAPCGVVSVMGNHDDGKYVRDTLALTKNEAVRRLVERQRSIGWRVLRNETMPVVRDGDTIYMAGMDFPAELLKHRKSSHRRVADDQNYSEILSEVPDSSFCVVAAHTPGVWEQLLATGKADLTVSGHVHSMQMKLRAGGWQWSPARLLHRHWSGLYGTEDASGKESWLYVNDGIGYAMLPMRIGCRPEVTLIELRVAGE